MSTQVKVETLVYFDLEATGLKSHGKPRITELSCVAVSRGELAQLGAKIARGPAHKEGDLELELLPRVLNKLSLCVYPMTTILPLVTQLTGLDNYNLTGQATFDPELVSCLSSFLNRLPSPVCLVAHNGAKYDFPLLQAELTKLELSLDSDLLCCDSLLGTRAVLAERSSKEESRLEEEEVKAVEGLVDDSAFKEELKLAESSEECHGCTTPPPAPSSVTLTPPPSDRKRGGDVACLSDPKVSRAQDGERTPERCITEVCPPAPAPSQPPEIQASIPQYFKARKKLDFRGRRPILPPSYALSNLHLHLLGHKPKTAHGAEADCLALLRTTAALGEEWLEWVDGRAEPLYRVDKMW